MSQLVNMIAPGDPVSKNLDAAFVKALAEGTIHKNTLVIGVHGNRWWWCTKGNSWVANVETQNPLNLSLGNHQMAEVLNTAKKRFPWAKHIYLWCCNPGDGVLAQPENFNLCYHRGMLGSYPSGRLDFHRTVQLPAKESARRPK